MTLTDPDGTMLGQEQVSGDYHFEMTQGKKAYLTPWKNSDHINGVSTRDLIDIQQHLLGIEKLESWYQRQAADANADGSISTLDVVQLRKLILAMIDELPDNTSWRFYDKASHQEHYNINPMRDIMRVDFMGVKIGDVNLDSDPTRKATRSNRSLKFVMNDRLLTNGNSYEIPVSTSDFKEIAGLQYTLQFDPNKLKIDAISASPTGLRSPMSFNLNNTNQGWLTSSWFDEAAKMVTLPDDTEIFTIKVTALSNVQLSDAVSINSSHTRAEAYYGEEDLEIALFFKQHQAEDEDFALYQNRPNPFSHETVIGFRVPEATQATLTIYDVTGRVLKQFENQVDKGYHEFTVERLDLNSNGILYYKLETDHDASVRKMILIAR
jgi:hypothetical protein